MGKSTISMAIFNSKLLIYQRVWEVWKSGLFLSSILTAMFYKFKEGKWESFNMFDFKGCKIMFKKNTCWIFQPCFLIKSIQPVDGIGGYPMFRWKSPQFHSIFRGFHQFISIFDWKGRDRKIPIDTTEIDELWLWNPQWNPNVWTVDPREIAISRETLTHKNVCLA